MMGSETGAKWLLVLVLYFGIMTFLVSIIGQISSGEETGFTGTTAGYECGVPRTIYEQFSIEPIDTSDISTAQANRYNRLIECGQSVGVISNTSCLSLNGCSWEDVSYWWQSAQETCTGELNYTGVTDNSTWTIYGTMIDEDNVCTQPAVLDNQTLCEKFSCTWAYRGGLDNLNVEEVEVKLGTLGQMWQTIKGMFSFTYDFGFDDASANYILNFIIFWIPLLGVILAIYVLVRS